MKLSIEEKAKAYDDLLAKLQKAKVDNDVCDERYCCVIDDIVPELKESEDEKIRKAIIEHFAGAHSSMYPYKGFTKEQILAWLEKQGEHINFCNKIQIGDKVTRNDNSELVNLSQLERVAKPSIPEIVDEHFYEMLDDKTEPKFKVGDWITHNTANFVFKITSVGSNGYEVINRENYKKTISSDNEDKYHLWTIQDAKDGDILYCKSSSDIEYIVMSKGVNKHGNIDSYFRYNSLDGFGVDIPNVLSTRQDNITPATKEQRDLLFNKMHEAGYEWDAEKKELKKIDQNFILNEIQPKQITHEEPAWSEEDEEMVINIGEYLNRYANYIAESNEEKAADVYKSADWLKFLKERVQPQPKQEWSNWDKTIIESIEALCDEKIESVEFQDVKEHANDIKDWLTDLKERCTWKPSIAQLNALSIVSKGNAPDDIEAIVSLYQDLKKLREERV